MKIAIFIPEVSEVPTEEYDLININDSHLIHDGSCEELFIGDCLDYITSGKEEFISAACSKVKYGGRLILTGHDLQEICKAKSAHFIDESKAQSLLYGGKTGLSSASTTVDKISSKSLVNINKRINNFKYTLIFQRPEPNENTL